MIFDVEEEKECEGVIDAEEITQITLNDINDEETIKGNLYFLINYSLKCMKTICVGDSCIDIPYEIFKSISLNVIDLNKKITNIPMVYDMPSYDKLVDALNELKDVLYHDRVEKDQILFGDYNRDDLERTQKIEKLLTNLILSHNKDYIGLELKRLLSNGTITDFDLKEYLRKHPKEKKN